MDCAMRWIPRGDDRAANVKQSVVRSRGPLSQGGCYTVRQTRRVLTAGVAALALAMSVAACGGDDGTDSDNNTTTTAEFNAGVGKVFSPSDKKGGIIKLANAGD